MSVDTVAGEKVHFPKRRDTFQFDAEVSSLFDDMAPRSIPMYNEVHRLHVSMFRHLLQPGAVVADIGSSTGHLFRNIAKQLDVPFCDTGIKGYAVDVSADMMLHLRGQFPEVKALVGDITDMPDLPEPVDLMFCLYTLQFITDPLKPTALRWLVRNLKVGGVLVLGQKEVVQSETLRMLMGEEYYQFRRDNGYSQQEIDAKTAALQNAMWPMPHDALMRALNHHRMDCVETTRWLQFSTVSCVRRP
jgi:tRNA (cmo5U34)-methyltransferase